MGLSQEELAHALGVSFATVNRWENGRTAPSKLALRQFEHCPHLSIIRSASVAFDTRSGP